MSFYDAATTACVNGHWSIANSNVHVYANKIVLITCLIGAY